MPLKSEYLNDTLVIYALGQIDALNAAEFERECLALIEQKPTKVIMDLSDIKYISSAGLRSILSVAKGLRAAGGEISFCGLSRMAKEVFNISGFIKIFPVYATLEEAAHQ